MHGHLNVKRCYLLEKKLQFVYQSNILIYCYFNHHHHNVPEGLGVFPVP